MVAILMPLWASYLVKVIAWRSILSDGGIINWALEPLGLSFDAQQNLYVCVGGMGLYRVTRDRQVEKVTDETNRSMFSVIDDSRLKLADDLDIAPDGRIFFSEATVRYEMHEWPTDALEGRGNGRIICYDPRTRETTTVLRNLIFPNGIALASDRQSILFAETWGCSIKRYWFEGPKKGTVEIVIDIAVDLRQPVRARRLELCGSRPVHAPGLWRGRGARPLGWGPRHQV